MWPRGSAASVAMRTASAPGYSPSLDGGSSITVGARPFAGTSPSPRNSSEAIDATGDVEGEAMASLQADAAVALIASLPSDQCDVVLLRVIGDLSVADVAKILDKRPGAVRALQHRALKHLALIVSREGVTG